ncbi:MAG: DUF2807 domain-containing protein [Bacteroidales bacterium]|nr:DUF2807 domain-containing protein [Bacteroidales bacterium]
MKRTIFYILLLMSFSSCEKNFLDGLTSTGEIITEFREIDTFKRIIIKDDISLIMRQDTAYKLIVEGGRNIIENYLTEFNAHDSSLTISNSNTMNWLRDFHSERNVYLSIPYTQDSLFIDYYSSGGIYSEHKICLDTTLHINVWQGSGEVNMDLKIKGSGHFREQYGTTNWNLTGKCGNVTAYLHGYGLMSMEKLEVGNFYFTHGGTNNILIAPSNSLIGKISGIGKVKCYSRPEIVVCKPVNSPNLVFMN